MCTEGSLGHTLVGEHRKQNWPEGALELSCLGKGQAFGSHLSLAAPRETAGTMLGKEVSSGRGRLLDRHPAVSCELPALPAPGG